MVKAVKNITSIMTQQILELDRLFTKKEKGYSLMKLRIHIQRAK
jgi:hypothetical protein